MSNSRLTVSEPVEEKLVELGYDPQMGARPLRRVIQEQIEDQLAEYYLDHPKVKQFEAVLDNQKILVKEYNVADTELSEVQTTSQTQAE